MAKEKDAPRAAAAEREAAIAEQRAEIDEQVYYLNLASKTGWTPSEAEKNMRRLQTEGDFFDDEGRWTLDVTGFPVCHRGWKPEPIEAP